MDYNNYTRVTYKEKDGLYYVIPDNELRTKSNEVTYLIKQIRKPIERLAEIENAIESKKLQAIPYYIGQEIYATHWVKRYTGEILADLLICKVSMITLKSNGEISVRFSCRNENSDKWDYKITVNSKDNFKVTSPYTELFESKESAQKRLYELLNNKKE